MPTLQMYTCSYLLIPTATDCSTVTLPISLSLCRTVCLMSLPLCLGSVDLPQQTFELIRQQPSCIQPFQELWRRHTTSASRRTADV